MGEQLAQLLPRVLRLFMHRFRIHVVQVQRSEALFLLPVDLQTLRRAAPRSSIRLGAPRLYLLRTFPPLRQIAESLRAVLRFLAASPRGFRPRANCSFGTRRRFRRFASQPPGMRSRLFNLPRRVENLRRLAVSLRARSGFADPRPFCFPAGRSRAPGLLRLLIGNDDGLSAERAEQHILRNFLSALRTEHISPPSAGCWNQRLRMAS